MDLGAIRTRVASPAPTLGTTPGDRSTDIGGPLLSVGAGAVLGFATYTLGKGTHEHRLGMGIAVGIVAGIVLLATTSDQGY